MTRPGSITATTDASPRETYGRHQLTGDQVRFFDEHGFLVLRDHLPADLLERLRDAASAWIADGLALDAADPALVDYQFAHRPGGDLLFRVDYLHGKGQPASLELLGAPEILAVAESLCGPDLVPTYESLVFKNEGDGAPIPWHQDAVHPRRHRIVNIDVYLDHSRTGAGALRVIPGSQQTRHDVCRIRDEHGWTPPGMVEVALEAGDVLVHDVMIVHGSEPVQGNPLRRTVYLEFRPAEQILAEGPWDRDWIDKRIRLLPLALSEHQRARPDADQFDWQPSPALRPKSYDDEAVELRLVHLVHSPASYCSAGDVARDGSHEALEPPR